MEKNTCKDMKRSGFKRKVNPSSFLRKPRKPLKRTRLHVAGHSSTKQLKQEIQDLLRAIVMKRDGGCIFKKVRHCGGEIGEAVIQADHLITRANSATYADSRLVVCVCRNCHFWKKYHKGEYDALAKTLLEPQRVMLWEACEKDSWKPTPMRTYDWKMAIVGLKSELKSFDVQFPPQVGVAGQGD